jgi:YggT family protein
MPIHKVLLFYFLVGFRYVISALSLLIIIRVILSWINPYVGGRFYEVIKKITEPVLRPLRLVIVFGGTGLDLSPIIAIILLSLLEKWLFILISNF